MADLHEETVEKSIEATTVKTADAKRREAADVGNGAGAEATMEPTEPRAPPSMATDERARASAEPRVGPDARRIDLAVDEMSRLCGAVGMAGSSALVAATLRAMTDGCAWPTRSVTSALLPCGFSHRAPCCFSMVLGEGSPEVRVLLEAQSSAADPSSYWAAGERVSAWIATQPGASVARLDEVAPLFVPTEASAPFRVWHGVVARPREAPLFKVYLSALAQGRSGANERVEEAMRRLGLEREFSLARESLAGMRHEITILSLDLSSRAEARVKLYVVLPDATAHDVERVCEVARSHQRGDALRFASGMLGDAGVSRRLWWLVCFTFEPGARERGDARPSAATIHLGIPRHIPDDGEATARIGSTALSLGCDTEPYERALAALFGKRRATRHHFVTFQRARGAPRFTVYFMPTSASYGREGELEAATKSPRFSLDSDADV